MPARVLRYLLSAVILFSFSAKAAAQQAWSLLGSGTNNGVSGICYATTFYHGALYAGGSFINAGGNIPVNHVARWDSSAWWPLGGGVNGTVRAMLVFNDELYVAGSFTMAGTVPANNIAKWNGASWDSVGHGVPGNGCYALTECNGLLYAGGDFDTAGFAPAANIASWNGNSWAPLGAGIGTAYPQYANDVIVRTMTALNGVVYVGGDFDVAGTTPVYDVAAWDGNNWMSLNYGLSNTVYCLAVYNGHVYAGGDFFGDINYYPMHNLCWWNGQAWMAAGFGGTNGVVHALVPYGNKLYIGGGFSQAGWNVAHRVASYDGNNFAPVDSVGTVVWCMAADEGIIYAGGSFTTAGAVPAKHIAKYASPGVGIAPHETSSSVSIFPNPADGFFFVDLRESVRDAVFELYDAQGRKILSQLLTEQRTEIDAGEAEGVYFYRLLRDGKMIGSGKLLLR